MKTYARLSLVSVLLVVMLLVIGTFDSIRSKTFFFQAARAATTSTWTFCAVEDSVCSFSGTRQVRYGIAGQYALLTRTAQTPCSNQVFGDPAVGVDKTCEFETVSNDPAVVWTRCAVEDGVCNFSGTMQVRYGVPGKYVTQIATTSIACSNAVFGDPAVGLDKTCDTAPPPPVSGNPIALENAKAGTTAWQLVNPAVAGEIEGYASATSVRKGSSIDLYVSTAAASFNIDIYRMGYYAGKGARLMQSITNIAGAVQPKPCLSPAGVIECNWKVTRSIAIPNSATDPASLSYWPSGVYLARLSTTGAAVKDSYILFVVRDDARAATYVSQLPVTTYQAYNYWGGKSLYTGCAVHDVYWGCADGSVPASAVSFNRPYGASTNPLAQIGVGAGEFLTNVQPVSEGYPISSAGFDYNMVRWMEQQGYDVKYITNLDLHEQPAILANARAFLSTGHDEYYSRTMRDRLLASRDAGVNLAFFSSNQVYWQVRFVAGAYGANPTNRVMICYRRGGDPVTDPVLGTGKFRDLGQPEAALLGAQYVADPVVGGITLNNTPHWLFTGTGATAGAVLNGLLGYEVNAVVPGISPSNVVTLAHSASNGFFSDMSYYVAPSSAQVFGTGSMQWSWGLDSYIPNGLRSDYSSPIARAITANVFSAIADQSLFSLQNAGTGLYLGTPPDNTAASQTIQAQAVASAGKSNQWRLLPYGDGNTQVVARANGLCLDAYGATAGSAAGTYACHGLPHQRWLFSDVGNTLVTISDRRSQLCLSAQPGSTAGSGLVMQPCSGSALQQWKKAAS